MSASRGGDTELNQVGGSDDFVPGAMVGERGMEDDHDGEESTAGRKKTRRMQPYSLGEFREMWEAAERTLGTTTESLDGDVMVRKANKTLGKKTDGLQKRAMYGRLLPDAVDVSIGRMPVQQSTVCVPSCVGSRYTSSCLPSFFFFFVSCRYY
jgi:hypothetical protein